MSKKGYSLLSGFLGVILLTVVDQFTKYLAFTRLRGQENWILIPGVFELEYVENRGAAFGMLQEKQLLFFLIAVLVLAGVLYMLWRMPDGKHYRPLAVCLMLIASGAVGNMIDRITQSYVVDFLYFSLINFPIFNVADCYVTCSAVGLVLLIMFYYKDEDMAVFSFKKKGGDQ